MCLGANSDSKNVQKYYLGPMIHLLFLAISSASEMSSCGDAVLLVDLDDLLDLIVTAQEDSATVVDVLGHDCNHPTHLAVNCLATG